MATKKKAKKKKAPAKRVGRASQKKSAQKKASPRKKAVKRSAKPAARTRSASGKRTPAKKQTIDQAYSGSRRARAFSGDADSQGLSEVERADSESVSELLDEGNTFEAGVVSGVEQADDADEREVRTREVLEDEVPEEYLEKD